MNFKQFKKKTSQRTKCKVGFKGLYTLQDSLNLLRKGSHKGGLKKHEEDKPLLSGESCDESMDIDFTDKMPICNISDNGLDWSSTEENDSIEITRDASTSCATGAQNMIPEIFIEKAGRDELSNLDDIMNTTENMNIKNSTMNHPHDDARLDVKNLSPIAYEKQKRCLLPPMQTDWLAASTGSILDQDETEALSTGNTPCHVKRALKKMRAHERRAKLEVKDQSNSDWNNNSLDFFPTSEEPDGLQRDFEISLSDEESDDWSPSKTDKKEKQDPKWLEGKQKEKKVNYLHRLTAVCNLTPAWKKSIAKPARKPSKKSFRTSSPSPYAVKNIPSPKAKRSILQLSSIQDYNSDTSVELRPRPVSRGTINSDEIEPLSPSCNQSQINESQIVQCVFEDGGPNPAAVKVNPTEETSPACLALEKIQSDQVVTEKESEVTNLETVHPGEKSIPVEDDTVPNKVASSQTEGSKRLDLEISPPAEENNKPSLQDDNPESSQKTESSLAEDNVESYPRKSMTHPERKTLPDGKAVENPSLDPNCNQVSLTNNDSDADDIFDLVPSPVHFRIPTDEKVSFSQMPPDDTFWDHF